MTPPAMIAAWPYAESLPPHWRAVREPAAAYRHDGHLTERHLQCIWSDDKLRPAALVDDRGEPVEIGTPGRWNLEAGPDFLDAVIRVGPERRQLIGDVEIHIHPQAWKQHHHGTDPNYARVVAHVTYAPGPRADDGLPPHVIRIFLRDALRQIAGFAFDDIDLGAYPHAVIPPSPRPCALALGSDPDRCAALLIAAGKHRLELKRQRMLAQLAQTRDPAQTFYETFMAALGYKQNSQAFRRLAQLLPLSEWTKATAPATHYARLLQLAGLLPDTAKAKDEASRELIRRLWDLAWRNPVSAPDAPIAWKLGAMRPANHPARRIAVAAALFGAEAPVESLWSDLPLDPPEAWFKTVVQRLIHRAELECWNDRLTLTRSSRGSAQPALLGTSTAATLATNVIVPFMACTDPASVSALLPALPAEEINAPMRATAAHLFGRDHNPSLFSGSGLMQQGLLQIFADFCLNAHAGCANCNLASTCTQR